MRHVNLNVPLPDGLYRALRGLKRGLRPASGDTRDLSGDREIEWSWVAAQIPPGPGEALDFGCGGSHLAIAAAHRGYRVTAVDLGPVEWPYHHERLSFLQGDILELDLGEGRFDLVLNCSSIEHVGLTGRYGVTKARPDGDLAAMARLRALMKPGGLMLLTVPAGSDATFPPWHRVYGSGRLPRLLAGFAVERSEFWLKNAENRWASSDERTVVAAPSRERLYGLGCFALRRP